MPRFHLLAAGAAALTLAAAVVPATAQSNEEVPVLLQTTAGSRTIAIEDMLGQPLESLDFGNGRNLPFRVRVQDVDHEPSPFSVNASLTNLYLDGPSGLTVGTKVPSAAVTLSPQLNPLGAVDVVATVQPVVDLVTTLTGGLSVLCPLAGSSVTAISGGCQLTVPNVAGNVLDVPLDVPLDDLPLVPQAPATGDFVDAEYGAGVGLADDAGDDGNGGRLAGTQLRLVSGQPVSASAVLADLTAAVQALPIDQVISDQAILEAINAASGLVTQLTAPLTVDDLLAATVATVDTITGGQLVTLTGQYLSLPKLTVDVPAGLPAGTYKGTLVVTGLQ